MKRELIVATTICLTISAAVAEVVPKNSIKYRPENSKHTVHSCEIQLGADGFWKIKDGHGKNTVQLYLAPPRNEHGAVMPQGRRMRAVQHERNINLGQGSIRSLVWVCSRYAQQHGGIGPATLDDLDVSKHRHVIDRVKKSPWQHIPGVTAQGPYVFLIPRVVFKFDSTRNNWVRSDNRNLLAVELTPFVDDGKHWVAYTDGRTERVAIDQELVEKYNLKIRPVTQPSDYGKAPEERTYVLVAVQAGDDQRRLDISLENTLTETIEKVRWPLSESRADEAKTIAALKHARRHAWLPYIYRSDAPAMRLWSKTELGSPPPDPARGRGRRGRRGRGETTSVFGVMGGRAAVRETLQMYALGNGSGDGERTIHVDTVQGVTVQSHPYAEMLGTKRGGSLPLAEIVPQDRFFVYAAKPSALFPFLDDGAEFLSSAGSVLVGNSIKYDLKKRYLGRFGMGETWLRKFLDSGAVKELALVAPDMFFVDGTEVSVISRLGRPGLIGQMLKLIGVWGLSKDNVVERKTKAGATVYWAMRGDLLFVSTSAAEMKALLSLNANGGANSLGKSAEFRYMLTQLPVTKDTRIYAYFSDAFIRRLVGPEVKIAQLRRIAARSDMEAITAAALLAKLNGTAAPPSIESLVRHGYLKEHYLKGDYSISDDSVAQSKRYGTLANMATFSETPVTMITDKEKQLYTQYVANYSRFWRRFFDPIAMRLDDAPDKSLELTTFILPLIDNSIYNALREALHTREDNRILHNPVIEPRPVVKLSMNLREKMWIGVTEGVQDLFERYVGVSSALLDDLGPGFHLAVHDADPVIAIGSGDLMGSFNANMIGSDDELMFPVIISVLTRPCTLLIETQNPTRTKRFLRQAAYASSLGRRRSGWFGMDMHQVADRDEWVLTMDVEGIIKARLGAQVEGRYLMIRNIPWSSADKVVEVRESQLNGARLDAFPGACKKQLAGLHASAADRFRVAAGNSMGYIYPLLLSKRADLDNIEDTHKALFGFRPVHPGSGNWRWDGVELSSTSYGSVLKQTSPPYDEKKPVFGLLGEIDFLNISMQFENTGLRTKVHWKTRD